MTSAQVTSQSRVVNNYLRSLPLYDTLSVKVMQRINQNTFSITPEYKLKLINVLNSLDPAKASEICLLVIHYYFLTIRDSNPFIPSNCTAKSSRNIANNLPYDIRVSSSGKGISFDIDKLPAQFQALLGICCLSEL